MSASPAVSSASMVLAKVGSAGSAAMAATSAAWAAKARAKAGRKCSGSIRPKGGTPKGPDQSSNNGLASAAWAASAWLVLIHEDHMGFEFLHCTVGEDRGQGTSGTGIVLNFSDVKQPPRLLS